MVLLIQEFLYATIHYLPYVLLIISPFKVSFKYTHKQTLLYFIIFSIYDVSLTVAGDFYWITGRPLTPYILLVLLSRLFFLCSIIKAPIGRIAFTYMMVKNFSDAMTTIASFFENIFFPSYIYTQYSLTNTLCLGLLLLIFYSPMLKYVRTNFSRDIRDEISDSIWHWLWIIPFLFFIIYNYIIYFADDAGYIATAIQLKTFVIIVVTLAGQLFAYYLISQLVEQSRQKNLLAFNNEQLTAAVKYQENLMSHINEIRVIKHDMHHRLFMISAYLNKNEIDKAKSELDEYIKEFPTSRILYCHNQTLNSLLVYYADKLMKEGIEHEISIKDIENFELDDSEIAVLFGNLLENAFDAAMSCSGTKRFLRFKGLKYQGQLIFVIENTYSNLIIEKEFGRRYSSKHQGRGIGIESSRMIVEKHNGKIKHSYNDYVYTVSIILPTENKKTESDQ